MVKILHTDMASFTGAGHGVARIPPGTALTPGETVYLVDDEADAVEAEVLSVADNTAQVRIRWDRSPVPMFELEVSPTARRIGVMYLHDVYLDADQNLAVGDSVLVRDEGGTLWVGEVTGRDDARLGHKYRLQIGLPPNSSG
ncbi:hypothetical protein IEZ26_15860 [Nocardioides cavernae]|uniref:Uncharacterized protein n=1 Tax=Nocardioides cavernae TaxID=1921566 RepID=A0ABR8NG10_9ACTN|nr:hypothetical protein [Nocardioides cavernae]MBD3926100.1 hypothetical protein [Nocardioides cavernae]MBM7513689.1 hypothetical protein [Nocardioides cavernae]